MAVTKLSRPFGWGADLRFEDRPGVPRERREAAPVAGAHTQIPQQPTPHPLPTHRKEIAGLTPVFGTRQPPQGIAGLLRRVAYQLPETRARHWLLLLFADRVDVLTHRLRRAGTRAATAAIVLGVVRRVLA